MKLSANTCLLPFEMDLKEAVRTIAKYDLEGYEINLCNTGQITLSTTEDEIKDIVRTGRDNGVEISSISAPVLLSISLTDNDSRVREEARKYVSKLLQMANWAGVDTVLVVPGVVNKDVSYDVALKRATAAIDDILKEAEERKVTVAVENVWNRFILAPTEMKDFLDSFKSPYIGAYFDVGNVLAYGFPEQWIRILGRRIKRIHVKDFRTAIGSGYGFCNLLEGDVDWKAVKTALKDIGYNGWITVEIAGYPQYPEIGLKHATEAMKAIFG